MTFPVLLLVSLSLVSSSATESRRLTETSPHIVFPKDVNKVICSYLTYTDQLKSFLGIDRRSYQTVHDLTQETIPRSIDSKNKLISLLHEPASVPRNDEIFKLRRQMMLDEQHALQWMDVWKQFGCWEQFGFPFDHEKYQSCEAGCAIGPESPLLLLEQCHFEFSEDVFSIFSDSSGIATIQSVYPKYQCPFNRKKHAALEQDERNLIFRSREITEILYLGRRRRLSPFIEYILCWEDLHFHNLLPRRIDVFDDEAIHCDSKQMRYLKYLISECGLMVIHPKDIAAAVSATEEGLTAMFVRDPPIARIQERGMTVQQLCARWTLDIFNKVDRQQWHSLVQSLDDFNLMCMCRCGDDHLKQSVEGCFKEVFGELSEGRFKELWRDNPNELWEILTKRRWMARQAKIEQEKQDEMRRLKRKPRTCSVL